MFCFIPALYLAIPSTTARRRLAQVNIEVPRFLFNVANPAAVKRRFILLKNAVRANHLPGFVPSLLFRLCVMRLARRRAKLEYWRFDMVNDHPPLTAPVSGLGCLLLSTVYLRSVFPSDFPARTAVCWVRNNVSV